MDTKTAEKLLKPYTIKPAIGEGDRWLHHICRMPGGLIACDAKSALAITMQDDAERPDIPADSLPMVLKNVGVSLDRPRLSLEDIEEALSHWPTEYKTGKLVPVKDPGDPDGIMSITLRDDGTLFFQMPYIKRLAKTMKALKRHTAIITHFSDAQPLYMRVSLGNGIQVVVMPYTPTDPGLVTVHIEAKELSQLVPTYVDGFRVVLEHGLLVGYKETASGLSRIVTNTDDVDEFSSYVKKPKPKKSTNNVIQLAIE